LPRGESAPLAVAVTSKVIKSHDARSEDTARLLEMTIRAFANPLIGSVYRRRSRIGKDKLECAAVHGNCASPSGSATSDYSDRSRLFRSKSARLNICPAAPTGLTYTLEDS
jgi:hypothetical protein